ncbi:MAG TPA: hypothetical protein VM345_17905 [Acidimicrobiales bacterium]|jgi:hypothetical protein|nr:hypothetical protein [Acidimicrobiales bacterium]
MTFDERLELARTIRARVKDLEVPAWFEDQANAAAAEATEITRELAGAFGWDDVDLDGMNAEEGAARTLAALLDCMACPHLRRGGPQPALARLAVRRVDCLRCAHTVCRPPSDEVDRCDWCGARGVQRFQPAAIQLGMTLVIGDRCRDCSTATSSRSAA